MSTARNLFAQQLFDSATDLMRRGAKVGFPNLTDQDWLWGNWQPKRPSINHRVPAAVAMRHDCLAWGEVLGKDGTDNMVAYVLTLSAASNPPSGQFKCREARQLYETICAACHGVDGKGNMALGAPNLTDKIWLHGSSRGQTFTDLHRQWTAPTTCHAHLRATRRRPSVRLLAAYVLKSVATGS